ncbi:MAG TPA: iron-containing alcohol dehydrogenase [Candidatus Aminicenantes bacterium]|nr:iron-containing alcohol dehydrogenase [Candidatus Aminicenantes bacterium]
MVRFYLPTKIVFGAGSISKLGKIVEEELKASRVFLVTDKGIREAGIDKAIVSQFKSITVFDAIEPNPRHTTVNRAGSIARKMRPDLIIGLGGGSSLDAAKAVALLVTNKGSIEDYEGKHRYVFPPIPVLAVPTTCGTGSEVTWSSVITHTERNFKMSIKGPHTFPSAAVVDPDLLITLPQSLIASTGMDALVHAVEAFSVKPSTFITDLFAKEAVRLIFHHLERAYKDIKGDKEARENLMKGSMLAGAAFGNSDVGAVHCIAEAVGALYDIPHGVANSIFLPYVMEFNLPEAESSYADIAGFIGINGRSRREAAERLIKEVRNLSSRLNIPRFKDIGIEESQFPLIAEKSYQNNSNPSNPRKAKVKDYLQILNTAFSD